MISIILPPFFTFSAASAIPFEHTNARRHPNTLVELCDFDSLVDDGRTILSATCLTPAGEPTKGKSTINLNDCVGNAGGVLQGQVNGGFWSSCPSCTLYFDRDHAKAPLTCTCNVGGSGKMKESTLNLNDVLRMTDAGDIEC